MPKWTVEYTAIPTNFNQTFCMVVEAADASDAIAIVRDKLRDLALLSRNDYKAKPYVAPPKGRILTDAELG